ncbi:MAG TPA: long-chain fatty acid--CoA ligase [Steroidobacteraceae bacterium]|nr:long-chain fatty acid--CoA ligase [Steroidobacteraceae bacterium]
MTDADDVARDLMQPWRLTVDRFITHAARWHGSTEVVERGADGGIRRTTYAAIERRARQVSAALEAGGVRHGTRVATLAMNGIRHVEAWFGIMGLGAVCHTLNPRLFDEQLVYIVNHARDRWLLADPQFAPLVERLRPRCPTLERIVYLSGSGEHPGGDAIDFESLLAGASAEARWGDFDEHTAAGLCYTSGTTGHPKGVLYSHRSQVLHTLITGQQDALSLSARDALLMIVPMFHANAWGLPFAAAAAGAKLVLPGPKLDPGSLYDLLEGERVTFSGGVPTVWQLVLDHLKTQRLKLSTLNRVLIGGSAVPAAVVRELRDAHGITVLHGWGMTEMSPIGTVSGRPNATVAALDAEAQLAYNVKQGRVPFGVDMKITDDSGARLAHDGARSGYLKVAGPAVIARYFGEGERDVVDAEGYFDTGDIGTIDENGYLQITDRAKDLIKSGGEWISSVEVENLAAGHPKALMAAVIAVPHPKWRERPLLIVKLKPGESATKEEFVAFLEGKIARWWMPDDIVFVAEMPLGATGKLDKKKLRAQFPAFPAS